MIPLKYLSQMGAYSIKVQGVAVHVHVVDEPLLVEKHVTEFAKSAALDMEPHVVGVDVKTFQVPSEPSQQKILVLCTSTECLIIYIQSGHNVPTPVMKFLSDSTFCFVKGVGLKLSSYLHIFEAGEEVGRLAARVLKKPSLTLASLADIGLEAGVWYEGLRRVVGREIQLDKSNHSVMTQEQVELAVKDAFMFYQIGYRLLSCMQPFDYLTEYERRRMRGGKCSFFSCFSA